MTQFRYNKHATVNVADAKKARRVVVGTKILGWGTLVFGLMALILFTPFYIWGPLLMVIGGSGIMTLLFIYGERITDWYKDQVRYYRSAKEYGVRDE